MINLSFNPSSNSCLPIVNRKQGHESFSGGTRLRNQLIKDTVSFTRLNVGVVSDMDYKNVLGQPLISEQRPEFEQDLKAMNLFSHHDAKKRISSLSRYLKEDMVGFIIPEYEINGHKKGGYQWYERGAEFLLKGCKQNAKESDYQPIAKQLYGLLSVHDNYWRSKDFSDYLSTLTPSPAIKSTIAAVKELSAEKDISFTGQQTVSTHGYFSPMKAMEKLLNDGCAYSGVSLQFDDPTYKHDKIPQEVNASMEHIMPKSWGGPCDDANYMLTSQKANARRGNMPLIRYLKGAKN